MKVTIYQVKREMLREHGFMGVSLYRELHGVDLVESGVDLDRYNEVYSTTAKRLGLPSYTKASVVLEQVFETFKSNHPDDFEGRSLGIGDVVKVANRFFYCDSYGWKHVKALNVPKRNTSAQASV